MNLTDDAMQVSLRITAWSGRLYDRQASNHVAVHHDAAASAGRYNKRLLPKAAFAALTATVSACRTAHYENTVPWDDQGSRLLTVANYEHYTALMDGFRERSGQPGYQSSATRFAPQISTAIRRAVFLAFFPSSAMRSSLSPTPGPREGPDRRASSTDRAHAR